MFSDYHLHSDHSPDCTTAMERQILAAEALGMSELCFTDHLEFGLEEWGDIEIDLNAYRAEFERMRSEHIGIRLKFGIEAGISCPEAHFSRMKSAMASMPFDFVIASAHTLQGKNVLKDFHYEGDGLAKVCREYIPSILLRLKELEESTWSCVGHIDFPLKGALRCHSGSSEYSWRFAPDEMDALFSYIIEKGKCLEVNTSPWVLMPPGHISKPDWLKRYARLGGEYITIGSDSHLTRNTGAFFREALELARESGVKYLATFENMKPVFHPLSKL